MGSVFRRKRKDARANLYIEFSHGGKRIRRLAKGAETKTEARAILREIERQIDRGEFIPKKKREILFEVWADRYFEWSKLNKRSWKRDGIFMNHLVPFFKGRLLQNITPLMIEDYKKERKEKVSGATVNRELSCLRHMLNMAIDEEILIRNPVKKVRFFRERSTLYRILTPEEKERLIQNCDGYLKLVVLTALNTGMRRSEVLSMKWSQVDFERGFIRVDNTKNGKPRSIPLNSLLLFSLRAFKQEGSHSEFVFWNTNTQKPVQDAKRAFKTACLTSDISNLRFHDLRHNFASSLVENGIDIVTVSELLGHSDINLTAKRYSHPSPRHKRLAVEGLLPQNEQKSVEILPKVLPERLSSTIN